MKKILLTALMAAGLAVPAIAGDVAVAGPVDKNPTAYLPEPTGFYSAKEFQVDLYGTYSFADPIGPDDWGGGGGVNYFFTKYFGIGVEGALFNTPGDITASAAANVFLRMPINDSGVAVYVLAGGGALFNIEDIDYDDYADAFDRFFDGENANPGDDVLLELHAGGGVEFRCNSNIGVFVDGRYTWTDLPGYDFATIRAGIRIAF
jgi:opacity protein-like surface antigen